MVKDKKTGQGKLGIQDRKLDKIHFKNFCSTLSFEITIILTTKRVKFSPNICHLYAESAEYVSFVNFLDKREHVTGQQFLP